MSEEHGPTATLTESLEPTSQDVELVHEIVLRAQKEPLADDRLSLLAAYEAVFAERGLDPKQDQICYWLLLEILKYGVEGDALYAKFEHVLRNKGMEVVFSSDDEGSTNDTAPSVSRNGSFPRLQPGPSGSESVTSQQLAQGVTLETTQQQHPEKNNERIIDSPSAAVAQLMQMAVSRDRRTLLRQCLDTMRDQLQGRNLRLMERQADEIYQERLKFKVLTHWQTVQAQVVDRYPTADAFHMQHRKSCVLSELLDSARINRLQAMEEQRLRGMGLYRMTLASREMAFRRKIDVRLKQKYLQVMLHAIEAVSTQNNKLEDHVRHIQSQFCARIVQRAMSAMVQMNQFLQTSNAAASGHYESKRKIAALAKWTEKSHQTAVNRTQANDAHEFFLKRKYFHLLRNIVQARRIRRLVLGRWCLKRWQEFAAKKKSEKRRELYTTYRREYKVRLARRCLQDMANKVQLIARIQQNTTEYRNAKVNGHAHEIIVKWYTRSQELKQSKEDAAKHADRLALKYAVVALTEKQQQISHVNQLANKFEDLHVQDTSARCLKTMGRKVFEINRRHQDADAFRGRHDKQMIRSHVDQWRGKAAEKRGEGPLVLPPATPAQRRADQLNRLASTTPIFAPRTSFATRLREGGEPFKDIDEEVEEDDTK